MRHSLRMRLIIGGAGATAMVLLVMGVGLYLVLERTLSRQFDHVLLVRALAAADSLDWDDHNGQLRVKLDSDVSSQAGSTLHTLPQFLEIWNQRKHVIYRSAALGGGDLTFTAVRRASSRYQSIRFPDGRRGREVVLAIRADSGDIRNISGKTINKSLTIPLILAVGRRTDSLSATLHIVFWSVLLACLMATAVLAAALWMITSRSLRPLGRLAADIEKVGVSDLSERLEVKVAPNELVPVVDRLNDLLGRIEQTIVREKALTADMAHELRTPLAAIQTSLELSLSRSRDAEVYRQTINSTLAIARQMQSMVVNLLMLARAEAGTLRLTRETVVIGELFESIIQDYHDVLLKKIVQVKIDLDKTASVMTDRGAVGMVIRNIVDNAVAYVNVGGNLDVRIQALASGVEMRIANTGSAISEHDIPNVFERFWRGDTARSGDGSHCGLGLSLVRRLLQMLDGTISADSQLGGEFVIVVVFTDMTSVGPVR